MQTFIHQANAYGSLRQPFFFLIDFEQKKPLIYSLDESFKKGLLWDIQGVKNITENQPRFALSIIDKKPISCNEYEEGFKLVQQELQKGNSYLLNLTYPTEIQLNADLRQIFHLVNAPYKLLFEDQFVCFSPESFVQIKQNKIYTYPMKGTIDARQPNAKATLLNDEKEQREHYTIVDLMRNDLAMVAKNIKVSRFRYIDSIHTERGEILQTSSEIYGELEDTWQSKIGSILASLLPAGSISGAPKEKTVSIIQQAEKEERGYYTGIFGIFDGKNLNSAVAIRFIEQKNDKFYFRSGGGITIQSQLEDEYQELIAKVYLPIQKEK